MVRKQITQQSETIQEEIPVEVISKFDNDEQLVREFMAEGYSIQQLEQSVILHPTRFDPIVMLGDHTLGFWMDGGKKYQENSRTYQNRFS
jgi:hypothetical protein